MQRGFILELFSLYWLLIFHHYFGVLVEVEIIWILTGERVPTLSGDPGEVSVVQLLIHVAEVILVASHRSLDT